MNFFRARPKSPTEELLDGYRRFKKSVYPKERRLFAELTARGQNPKIMIISCSDSRVSPTSILSLLPGQAFIARNIANIVPPYDPNPGPRSIGAAAEYAIKVLGVEQIVVKGHARCGGVAALLDGGRRLPPTDYIRAWVEVAAPAKHLLPPDFERLSPDDQRLAAEHSVIQNSIMNLSGSPWVRERLDDGRIQLHGWHFDIHDGTLTVLDHESGEFRNVG